jgi:hypothetical protein
MKLKKCQCGGDALIFRVQRRTKQQLAETERKHGKNAAEFEKKVFTFYFAECLECEAKGEERHSYEDAARIFNQMFNIQEVLS